MSQFHFLNVQQLLGAKLRVCFTSKLRGETSVPNIQLVIDGDPVLLFCSLDLYVFGISNRLG